MSLKICYNWWTQNVQKSQKTCKILDCFFLPLQKRSFWSSRKCATCWTSDCHISTTWTSSATWHIFSFIQWVTWVVTWTLPILYVTIVFGDAAAGFCDMEVDFSFNLRFWRCQFRHFLRHQLVHTLPIKQDQQQKFI